ncbi:MAG TPA: histidine--tRNA ligase [Stellaceae bacterium]|jgi:histidyl-tRNA synthetase|nr:histidine--tRNA ligase [Stellaceae bacterium]
MPALQPVRGTQDLLPDAVRRHRQVRETARRLAELYGFADLDIPIFEFTEVFARPIGEHTDIVAKEMYSLKDRGGEDLSLRPEFTAGVVRAVLSNGLTQSAPLKFFSTGPVFRYERPQKGRFRQFHQINCEILGVPQAQADIELIALARRILAALGIGDRVVLELNTLGDSASRAAYREALVAYFSARRGELSADSQRRLDANPLRILDSKDPGDIGINADAPSFDRYLNDASRDFFAEVRDGLDRLGIAYRLNPRLVRGLDYYAHSVFEFVTTDLGAQGTVLAGGRYDGLVALMGGPEMPGVGWAAGIERLSLLIDEPAPPARPVALVPLGEAGEKLALTIAETLRGAAIPVDLGYAGNLSRRMRRANRINARAAVLLGDDEVARNIVTLRDFDSGAQSEVPMGDTAFTGLVAALRVLY